MSKRQSVLIPSSGVKSFITKFEVINKGARADKEVEKKLKSGAIKPEEAVPLKEKLMSSDMMPPIRCGKCRMILPDEAKVVRYGDVVYHSTCFVCHRCKKGLNGEVLVVLDRTYHQDCLSCYHCKTGLVGQSIACNTNTGELYCRDHAHLSMPDRVVEKVRCTLCKKMANLEEETVVEALGGKFHSRCFKCTACSKPLVSEKGEPIPYWLMDDKPYCDNDYQKLFVQSVKCAGCSDVIVEDEYMAFNELNFHPDCFACAKCHKSLIGVSFEAHDHHVWCSEHKPR